MCVVSSGISLTDGEDFMHKAELKRRRLDKYTGDWCCSTSNTFTEQHWLGKDRLPGHAGEGTCSKKKREP